jgi:hypothetical protein
MIQMKSNYKYYLIAIIFLLQGCSKYSPNDALKDLNKANEKQPLTTTNFVNEKFPCHPKSDTIVSTKVEYKYMDVICPPSDSADSKDTIYIDKIKTIEKTNVVKKVIAIPAKTITLIKYYEDSAKLKALSILNSQTNEELKKCSQKKEKTSDWNMWLIICLAGSVILNVILLRK